MNIRARLVGKAKAEALPESDIEKRAPGQRHIPKQVAKTKTRRVDRLRAER
jgi:hypothetical protein